MEYEFKEEMLEEIENFFEDINFELKSLIDIYLKLKSSEDFEALLTAQIVKKIIFDFLIWCEKLESAILENGEGEAIFIPNIDDEIKIINYFKNNTKKSDWKLPFFGGLGLGYLLFDD